MAVAEAGHFYKAADNIGLTQSALTQAISKLEKELGLQLFVRSKTGSVLTEHGRRLYDHAKVISGQIEAAETELKMRARQLGAEIRIGVVQSLSDDVLLEAISLFKRQYPDHNVKILKEWSVDLAVLLTEGEIDFAFLSDHFLSGDMPELQSELLFKDYVRVVVGEQHDLYPRRKLRLGDLSNHQWVAVSISPDWPEFLARVFASADVPPPRHVVRTNSMTLATALIQSGQAVGIVSPKLFHSANRLMGPVNYFDVTELRQERRFSLFRRARMVVRPFHRCFIDHFRSTVQQWVNADERCRSDASSSTETRSLRSSAAERGG